MRAEKSFLIRNYNFDTALSEAIQDNHYARDLWPLVYILSDGTSKEAYVGETTDVVSRMGAHLKTPSKKKLTAVHLITSETFNKSATLDIEANLIKYLSGDGQYKLLNANLGLANHNYYQKNEVYWGLFKGIWNGLRAEGITQHSLEHINNSDLFKYSPYKVLTAEQRAGLLEILNCLNSDTISNTVVEGGAGTGKTILAIFLFKLLVSDLSDFNFKEFGDAEQEFYNLVSELKKKYPNPKMGLVVPMASFRNTLKKVFKNIKGLNANMVLGPVDVTKKPEDRYDILVVDESHRLRQRTNLGPYFGPFDAACERLGLDKDTASELDWVLAQSHKAVFFYDRGQSIKPSDVKSERFQVLLGQKNTAHRTLLSQFRVKGGNAYVDFLNRVLIKPAQDKPEPFVNPDYELLLFDNLETMVSEIHTRDHENGLSRLIAGYAWEWVSKKQPNAFDIQIGESKLRWNSTSEDWINTPGAVSEVGCIHTTQGYDLNYAGIIFGHEIDYDPIKEEIIIRAENYKDRMGKQSIKDPEQLKNYILNIYKTILLRAIKGTYIYVCNPNLKAYLEQSIPKYKTNTLLKLEPLADDAVKPFQNCIPLYPLSVAAGAFGALQEVTETDWIEIPEGVLNPKDYFACRVVGASMNQVIPNNAICLFRKHRGGSRNGQIVLVELSAWKDRDFGSCYTVKEYQSIKSERDGSWQHEKILLKPLSDNPAYTPIELEADDQNELRILGEYVKVLGE